MTPAAVNDRILTLPVLQPSLNTHPQNFPLATVPQMYNPSFNGNGSSGGGGMQNGPGGMNLVQQQMMMMMQMQQAMMMGMNGGGGMGVQGRGLAERVGLFADSPSINLPLPPPPAGGEDPRAKRGRVSYKDLDQPGGGGDGGLPY